MEHHTATPTTSSVPQSSPMCSPSRTRHVSSSLAPSVRYEIIRHKANAFLMAIPHSLSDQYRLSLSSELTDIISECIEPPSMNVTFVGEMGAGKSRLLNSLLGSAVNKIGRLAKAGTAHPTKILYHKELEPKRALELLSAEEWKIRTQVMVDDAWDGDEKSDEAHRTLLALEAEFAKKLDLETLRDPAQIEELIKTSPYFPYLGETITMQQDSTQLAGNVKSAKILQTFLGELNTFAHIPVKFERRWLRSTILENGLNFVDSPGTGDTSASHLSGTNYALAGATMICIVTTLTRSSDSRNVRDLARMCQKQYLDGKSSQLVIVCTQADSGIPQSKDELLDDYQEIEQCPNKRKEMETLVLELNELDTQLSTKMCERDELRPGMQEVGPEPPRKRARYDVDEDSKLFGQRLPDGTTSEAQSHLAQIENEINALKTSIKSLVSTAVQHFVLARNRNTKQCMAESLSQWLPQMDVRTIPIFTVAAECFDKISRYREQDACHETIKETEIPDLLDHLRSTGSEMLEAHTAGLEQRLMLAAEQARSLFGSLESGLPDLLPALASIFGSPEEENHLNKILEEILKNRCKNAFEWLEPLELSCLAAVLKTKNALKDTPEDVFKDFEGLAVRHAAKMRATCRRNRRGQCVGIDFNERIAVLFLGSMEEAWGRAFFEMQYFFIRAIDDMSRAVKEQVDQLNSLQFMGNSNLKEHLLSIGKTEHDVFESRMKAAAYGAEAAMATARQKMRTQLILHIQQGLGPTYDAIMNSGGKGFVENAQNAIVDELGKTGSVLDTCTGLLVDGLRGCFSTAWMDIVAAVKAQTTRLKSTYMEMARNMDPADQADVETRRKFLECAHQILGEFGHDSNTLNSPAFFSAYSAQPGSTITKTMESLSV